MDHAEIDPAWPLRAAGLVLVLRLELAADAPGAAVRDLCFATDSVRKFAWALTRAAGLDHAAFTQ